MLENKFWVGIQVIALFCAYLIITIPAVSAVSIRAFLPGSDMPQTFSFTPADKVARTFEVSEMEGRYDEIWVKASIVGKDPQYIVKKIYLFMCGNADAGSCSEEVPIETVNYLSGERKTFKWAGDLAVGKIANFMTLVQLEYKGRGMWVGFWDQLERKDIEVFEHKSYEIDVLDIYLKDGVDVSWVKYYVQNYFMIPSNWMERAVLTTVGGEALENTHRLLGDSDDLASHRFVERTSDITVLPSEYTYTFVFGKDFVSSPITFFSEPATSCDGFECEAGLGENPETCCLDCGCRQENQECDVSTEYPGGLCHVCGDGYQDAVENVNNCCADAGCPEGQSCDTGRNEPYGTCMDPDCNNNRCDGPAEDVIGCCIDCGGTDACKTALGNDFYCNTDLVRCVEPVCGERGCEPGEDYSNCCLDCGGCPSGEYCNTTLSENGVCIPPGCGTNGCEPGEDSSSCCFDCPCPLDTYTGFDQTCTQNVCHLCGNGNLESVENEENCCVDSNCESGYCAADYSCRNTDELGINVFVEPEDGVDCRQGGNVITPMKVIITLENNSQYFSYFDSAVYSAYGKIKSLRNCMLSGEAYECEIPLTGSDIYVGCFEGTGIQDMEVSVKVGYYNDSEDYDSRDITESILSKAVNVTVEKSRDRICNKKDGCESALGEDESFCCHDCGCPYGFVCLDNTCSTENGIGLEVDETSLPDANQLVCNREEIVLNKVTFSADVINLPHTEDDPFNLASYGLAYAGKTYGSHNLTQFYCDAETTSDGLLTGKVNCDIPISVFPPCPYSSPQELELMLWVTGGGLSEYYDQYTGKAVSDKFMVSYVQGLPKCYDGYGICDDGENQANCCQDCGCPDGLFCSVLSGCVSEDDVTLTVWVEPEELDCSTSFGKTVNFFGEVDPKPIGSVFFEDTILDEKDIQYSCSTGFYTKYGSNYILECEIPYQNFDYCWGIYGGNAPFDFDRDFETTFSYNNGTNFRDINFTETASFTVKTPRERGCDDDMYCDPSDGEIPVQCCLGCGCSGGELCTFHGVCTDSEPELIVTDFPAVVDCSEYDEVVIKAEITNQPAWKFGYIKWNISVDGYQVDISRYCDEEYDGAIYKYSCDLSVRELPVCKVTPGCVEREVDGKTLYDCTKTMKLLANLSYTEPVTFEVKYVDPSETFTMKGEDILASCRNEKCDDDLGEDYSNCCEDCACPDGGICTLTDNCIPTSDIELILKPDSYPTVCSVVPPPGFVYPEWMDFNGIIDDVIEEDLEYACLFLDPVELKMELVYSDHSIVPYGLDEDVTGKYKVPYYEDSPYSTQMIDSVDTGSMEVVFFMVPLGALTKEQIPNELDVIVFLDLDVIAPGDRVIPIYRNYTINLQIEDKDSKRLLSLESIMNDFKKSLKRIKRYIGIIGLLVTTCILCPGWSEDPLGTVDKSKRFLNVLVQLFDKLKIVILGPSAIVGLMALFGVDIENEVLEIIAFLAGGIIVGTLIGGLLATYTQTWCVTSTIQSILCAVALLVSAILAFGLGKNINKVFFTLKDDYEALKERAESNIGDNEESWLYPPNSF